MNLAFAARIGKRLSAFLGGQSSVQLINGLTGLILLRLLPKPEFAIYSVALGIQTTINMLTDVGFGSAILGLVGTRYQDKRVLGTYIKAASSMRRFLLWIVTAVCVVCIVVFRHRHFEGHGSVELMFLSIAVLVTVQFQAWASYYETPLLLHNKLVSLYSPQIAAAALRMLGAFALYYLHIISSTSVIILNTVSVVIMGVSYRIMSRRWVDIPSVLPREHAREMVRYLLPLMPLYMYVALSGQISLMLITIFGHVSQIADVAAAGRIGQLFLVLNSSNGVLLVPLFARTPNRLFRKRYVAIMSVVGVVALLVAASARFFPSLYLLVLGAKYHDLTEQVQLVVYASALGYFTGGMWSVVTSRKWVFWWSGTAHVVVLTIVQLVCALLLPLNTSQGVLKMGIYTSLGALAVQVCYLIQGLAKETEIAKTEAAMAS